MSSFEELLDAPLPSSLGIFEAADEEPKEDPKEEAEETEKDAKKDDKKTDSDREDIMKDIDDVLKDLDGVDIEKDDKDDFLSGDEDEIEIEDLDKDNIDDIFDSLSSALDSYDVDLEKDDDSITVSMKESADAEFEMDDSSMKDFEKEMGSDMKEEVEEEEVEEEVEEEGCQKEGCCGEGCDPDDPFCVDPEEEADIEDDLEELDTETSDTEKEELSPVDDKKADDMLAMVATPMLIKDELTAEESVKFFESVEADIAVSEGLIEEPALDDIYTEGVFASPNKPYKMTKQARMNQLYEVSVQIEARAHRDPLMKQLDKAYAIERRIKAQLRKKYGAPAKKRAIGYLRRLIKSKSGVLRNLGKKIAPPKR